MKRRYRCIDGSVTYLLGVPVVDDQNLEPNETALTLKQLDGVVCLAHPPIRRCLAAVAVPESLLAGLFSRKMLSHLRRIGRAYMKRKNVEDLEGLSINGLLTAIRRNERQAKLTCAPKSTHTALETHEPASCESNGESKRGVTCQAHRRP